MHLTKVRTHVKRVLAAAAAKDGKAEQALKEAVRLLDKAAQKGVIKKETAARKISRLTKRVRGTAAAK
jgi:small subunit ribosomal protein S20